MQIQFSKILKHLYCYYLILHFYQLKAYAINSPSAIGKYQIAFDSELDINVNSFKSLVLKNFDVVPKETILKNDGQSVSIQMKYDINEHPLITLKGLAYEYRFEFMYFQWLEKVPKIFEYNNLTFHGQLHVVFYDNSAKNINESLETEKALHTMAFGIKVNPLALNKYEELQENLEIVRQPVKETVIRNMPLAYWLNVTMEHFCIYQGVLKLLNTPSKGYWLEFSEPIEIIPEILTEFELLQTADGGPLMNKYQTNLNDLVTSAIICNAEPYRNCSDRYNAILALIIMAQLVASIAFGLP